jgi:hypothetical protein
MRAVLVVLIINFHRIGLPCLIFQRLIHPVRLLVIIIDLQIPYASLAFSHGHINSRRIPKRI